MRWYWLDEVRRQLEFAMEWKSYAMLCHQESFTLSAIDDGPLYIHVYKTILAQFVGDGWVSGVSQAVNSWNRLGDKKVTIQDIQASWADVLDEFERKLAVTAASLEASQIIDEDLRNQLKEQFRACWADEGSPQAVPPVDREVVDLEMPSGKAVTTWLKQAIAVREWMVVHDELEQRDQVLPTLDQFDKDLQEILLAGRDKETKKRWKWPWTRSRSDPGASGKSPTSSECIIEQCQKAFRLVHEEGKRFGLGPGPDKCKQQADRIDRLLENLPSWPPHALAKFDRSMTSLAPNRREGWLEFVAEGFEKSAEAKAEWHVDTLPEGVERQRVDALALLISSVAECLDMLEKQQPLGRKVWQCFSVLCRDLIAEQPFQVEIQPAAAYRPEAASQAVGYQVDITGIVFVREVKGQGQEAHRKSVCIRKHELCSPLETALLENLRSRFADRVPKLSSACRELQAAVKGHKSLVRWYQNLASKPTLEQLPVWGILWRLLTEIARLRPSTEDRGEELGVANRVRSVFDRQRIWLVPVTEDEQKEFIKRDNWAVRESSGSQQDESNSSDQRFADFGLHLPDGTVVKPLPSMFTDAATRLAAPADQMAGTAAPLPSETSTPASARPEDVGIDDSDAAEAEREFCCPPHSKAKDLSDALAKLETSATEDRRFLKNLMEAGRGLIQAVCAAEDTGDVDARKGASSAFKVVVEKLSDCLASPATEVPAECGILTVRLKSFHTAVNSICKEFDWRLLPQDWPTGKFFHKADEREEWKASATYQFLGGEARDIVRPLSLGWSVGEETLEPVYVCNLGPPPKHYEEVVKAIAALSGNDEDADDANSQAARDVLKQADEKPKPVPNQSSAQEKAIGLFKLYWDKIGKDLETQNHAGHKHIKTLLTKMLNDLGYLVRSPNSVNEFGDKCNDYVDLKDSGTPASSRRERNRGCKVKRWIRPCIVNNDNKKKPVIRGIAQRGS